jgi:hypothetical protein
MNSGYKPILPSINIESKTSDVSSFLFKNDIISKILCIIWFLLLIYVITLMALKPLNEQDQKNESLVEQRANHFSYVATIFSLVSFIIYFRFFPLGWANNGTMKFINFIIAIVTLAFLFIIVNKSKSKNSEFETYKKNLIPFTATIFTLAAYSVTATIGNFLGTPQLPGAPGSSLPKITSTMFDRLFK